MKVPSGKCHFINGRKLVSSVYVCIWIYMVSQAAADGDDAQFVSLVHVPVCTRVPIPDFPSLYLQEDGLFLSLHRCHANTYFDAHECGCMPFIQVYRPEVYVPKPTRAPTTTTVKPTTTTATTTTRAPTTTTTTTTTTRRPRLINFFDIPVLAETGNLSVKRKSTTPVPDRLCDGCTFDRGVGYNTHTEDCDKYVLCYPKGGVGGHLTGEVRHCGIGQYWDPDLLTCRPSKDVICPYERCRLGSGVDTYSYDNDCRGYWRCENGVSVGHCCPRGEAYRRGFGCVQDTSCNTPCDTVDRIKGCDKTVVPGKPWKFRQKTHTRFVDMACAAGTVFNETVCRCQFDRSGTISNVKVCKKEFDLEFTDGLRDTSGSGNYVDSFNVTYSNGSACFNGDGALLLPRFSNAEIGNHLIIRIKFRFSKVGPGLQALVFNGDCDQHSSVVITGNQELFSLGLRSRTGKFQTLTMPSYPNAEGWYDVTFAYHSDVMSIAQGGQKVNANLPGGVSRSRCALKIGWGEHFESFTGCLDHLSISFCPES